MMNDNSEAAIVETTVATEVDAERIAAALLERRLAACVQIIALTSHYRWAGEVRRDAEHLLRIKTVRANLTALESALLALHPYDLPEIIVLPIVAGSTAYLDWLRAETMAQPFV